MSKEPLFWAKSLGIVALTTAWMCSGCIAFRDIDELYQPEDTDTGTDTESFADTLTIDDSTQGSETDTPSITDDDTGSTSSEDTHTGTGTDASTENTGSDTIASGTETETDSGSDSETTCEDACANDCCGEQCCQSATDTCFEEACCSPATCAELGIVCGQADDGCGGTVACGTCDGATAYCSETGACVDDCEDRVCGSSPAKGFDCGTCSGETAYCTVAGQCVDDCADRICGSSPVQSFDCGTCPFEAPYCTGDGQCVECTELEDVSCGGFTCDLETSTCVTDCGNDDGLCVAGRHCDEGICAQNLDDGADCDEASDCTSAHCQNAVCCEAGQTCCADQNDCEAATAAICSPSHHFCVSCADEDLCAAQYPAVAPFCDTSTGRCEQCVEHADCRDQELAANPSPVGVCAPDRTCTCVVETERGTCASSAECPAGTVCAKEKNATRFVCLRECDAAQAPQLGVVCEERKAADDSDVLVWAPMTTCFAFTKLGAACSGVGDCNVAISDGQCQAISGEFVCTYSCYDGADASDDWCPTEACDQAFRICQPQ